MKGNDVMKHLRFIHDILNVLYPNVCGMCDALCEEELCKKCEIKLENIAKIKIKYHSHASFGRHLYLFQYEGWIKEKLIAYKFQEKAYIYKSFAKFILNHKKICDFLKSYDIIIPVPIHTQRNRERGYNQSELLARKIAENLENLTLVKDALYKKVNLQPQSGKTKKERQQDVLGAYQLKNKEKITGKKVLLLDDIYTTGSTVSECCKVLQQAKVAQLDVMTIAKD